MPLWANRTVHFVTCQEHGGAGARGNQKLIMGPWPHVVMQQYGELKFPDNYNFDLAGYQRRFFRHWLLGEENGIMQEPAVHYYAMGDYDGPSAPGNEWRTADRWPPFSTKESKAAINRRNPRSLVTASKIASRTLCAENPCYLRCGAL